MDSFNSDDLIERCETFYKNSISKYDKYFEHQEKLRLQLSATNETFKYLKSWLEKAWEDWVTIKSQYGDLKRIYEMLLKNNFIEKIQDHEAAREKLQLKFMELVIQYKDLPTILNTVKDEIKSSISESQTFSTEEPLEYVERQKKQSLRLKCVESIIEYKRLDIRLNEACELTTKMKREHDDLINSYENLLQDTVVEEFLNYAKFLEEFLPLEPAKKLKCEYWKSSVGQSCNQNVPSSYLMLDAERQGQRKIEKESSSLGDFSGKLCGSFWNNFPIPIQYIKKEEKFVKNDGSIRNSIVENDSTSFKTNTTDEFDSGDTSDSEMSVFEVKENIEELDICSSGTDEDESHLSSTNEDVRLPVGNNKEANISLVSSVLRRDGNNSSVMSHNVATAASPKKNLFHDSREIFDMIWNFRCHICRKSFASRYLLNSHKSNAHGGKNRFKRDVCDRRFANGREIRGFKSADTLPPLRCPSCYKNFTYRNDLRRHMRYIHDEYLI